MSTCVAQVTSPIRLISPMVTNVTYIRQTATEYHCPLKEKTQETQETYITEATADFLISTEVMDHLSSKNQKPVLMPGY